MRGRMKTICCFCSSSDTAREQYFEAARELGKMMGRKQYALVYGGTIVGLMGELARSVSTAGGRVIGVVPKTMAHIVNEDADEVIWCKDLGERKAIMRKRSDSFIALPGAFGTFEEIMEVLALKQLNHHNKAVVFLDTDGFYSELNGFLNRMYREGFCKETYRQYYHFAPTPAAVMEFIESYTPPSPESKLF